MRYFASASREHSEDRRSFFHSLARSVRRYPLSWFLSAGLATAIACGGAGGGGGGATSFTGARVIFTNNIASQIRFAPDGRLFYTELKTGKIRIVSGGLLLATSFAEVPVGTDGEQGLLGLALDPDYANNKFVYAFYTQDTPRKQRIVRFTDVSNVGTNMTVIVDDLPFAANHCGGRIGFGQDNFLYVTLGDVTDPANSQSDGVVAGKILRYNATTGLAAAGNPVGGNPMYAKGLRNSFGLAFHITSGRPYVSENGPDCDDEINRIVSGGNFGWRPNQPCNDSDINFLQPIVRISNVIAPTGMTFYNGADFPEFAGDLFMGSFNDGAIRRYRINDANGAVAESELILSGRPGGVIDVTQGPDGGLYFCDESGIYRVVRR